MAQRRQQHQQRRQQYQRSPGNYGPPAKRPRTNVPPPLPPLDWDYDFQDRNQRNRYPPNMQYDEYDRMQDYQMRAPRRDYMQSYQEDNYYGGGNSGGGGAGNNDYRNSRQNQRRPQGHDNPYRDRQQFQQRQQHMQHRGQPMQNRGQNHNRGSQNRRGGKNRNQMGGGSGDWDRKRRDRVRKMSSPKSQGMNRRDRDDDKDSVHRNWTKTYWLGRGENPSKRSERKIEANIPEDTRFKILCGMMKADFRLATACETIELFIKENTVGLKPSFVFKREDGFTTCKFYLNSILVSEGKGKTRSDAKTSACDNATQIFERETSESILTAHDRAEPSKLGETADALDHSMISHLERFTGDKPLSNFVILQTEGRTDENKWNWTSILVQSAAFSRMELHFQLQGQEYKKLNCNVHIGGKFIHTGRGRLVKDAKNWGSKGAVEKLQKTCYTLLIKKGAKDEEKSLPGIVLHEKVGNINEEQTEEAFRNLVTEFFNACVEEEDMTKPLVITMTSFSNEEKEVILEIAKTVGYIQRDADIRRSKREEEKKEQERKEQEKKEKEKKEQEEKEKEKKESEEKEEKEEKTEKSEEEKSEEKAEEKEEEPEQKPETSETKDTENTEEKKEEEKKEEKVEEPPKIVLVRKYSGIDTLEYVLNQGGETWKYTVRPPGPPKEEKTEEVKKEDEKKEEEESKAEDAKDENGDNAQDGEGDGEGVPDEEDLECVDQADCGESGDEDAAEDEGVEEAAEETNE